MGIYEEVMKTYLESISKAPKECQECTRCHYCGCNGCKNSKYWDDKIRRKVVEQ
jgi:hypothetical protein